MNDTRPTTLLMAAAALVIISLVLSSLTRLHFATCAFVAVCAWFWFAHSLYLGTRRDEHTHKHEYPDERRPRGDSGDDDGAPIIVTE